MHRAEFDRQARQWNVVDEKSRIVGMYGGGKRGQAEAEESAAAFNRLGQWVTFIDPSPTPYLCNYLARPLRTIEQALKDAAK